MELSASLGSAAGLPVSVISPCPIALTFGSGGLLVVGGIGLQAIRASLFVILRAFFACCYLCHPFAQFLVLSPFLTPRAFLRALQGQ